MHTDKHGFEAGTRASARFSIHVIGERLADSGLCSTIGLKWPEGRAPGGVPFIRVHPCSSTLRTGSVHQAECGLRFATATEDGSVVELYFPG